MYCEKCSTGIHIFQKVDLDENENIIIVPAPSLCESCSGIAWENMRRKAQNLPLVREPKYLSRRDLGNVREASRKGKGLIFSRTQY